MKKFYDLFEEVFACSFFIVIFLLMVGGVVLRYFFSVSFAWNIELSRYSFVWLTFIGAAYVRRLDSHIKIDVLFNYVKRNISRKTNIVFWVVKEILTVLYLVLLIYFSYVLSVRSWRFLSQAMQMPQFFLYISVALGGIMYLFREIEDAARTIKSGNF